MTPRRPPATAWRAHVPELPRSPERNGPGRHLAQQAIDALLALKNAAGAAREAGQAAVSRKDRVTHGTYFTDAAKAGIALNAARRTKLQKKRHALATRSVRLCDIRPGGKFRRRHKTIT